MCHIADDSDDEEMSESLNSYDAKQGDGVEEEVNGPTFNDSEDDDEVEPEEEVEPEPAPKPKKKKKVVRRKKTSA